MANPDPNMIAVADKITEAITEQLNNKVPLKEISVRVSELKPEFPFLKEYKLASDKLGELLKILGKRLHPKISSEYVIVFTAKGAHRFTFGKREDFPGLVAH